jgi:hypothetical protein
MNPTNTQSQPAGQPIQPTAQLNKASEETTLKAIRKQLKSLNSENNIKVSHAYIEHITSSVENFQEAFQKEAQAAWDGMVTSMKKEGATDDFILGMTKEAEEYFQNIKTATLNGNTALSLKPQHPGTFLDGLLQNHADRIPAPATSQDLSAPATGQNPQNPIPLFSSRQSPDFIRDKYVGPPPRPQGLYLDNLLQESGSAPTGEVILQETAAQQPFAQPTEASPPQKSFPSSLGPLMLGANKMLNLANKGLANAGLGPQQQTAETLPSIDQPARETLQNSPQPPPEPAPMTHLAARGPISYPSRTLPTLPPKPELVQEPINLGYGLYNKANSLSEPVNLSKQFFPGSKNTPENYQIKGNNIFNNPGAQNSLASKRMNDLQDNYASVQAKAHPLIANNPSLSTPNTSAQPPTPQPGGLNPFASLSSGTQHAMGGMGGLLLSMLIGNALGLEGPMAWLLPMLGGITGYNFFPDLMKTINPN